MNKFFLILLLTSGISATYAMNPSSNASKNDVTFTHITVGETICTRANGVIPDNVYIRGAVSFTKIADIEAKNNIVSTSLISGSTGTTSTFKSKNVTLENAQLAQATIEAAGEFNLKSALIIALTLKKAEKVNLFGSLIGKLVIEKGVDPNFKPTKFNADPKYGYRIQEIVDNRK